MIKVLIVDDSQTSRFALRKILERDSDIFVVGEAGDGEQAMHLIRRFEPHFVTMDIYLERENGLDLTKQIMTESPRPILVVTGVSPHDPDLIYRALENGALDVFAKPPGPMHDTYPRRAEQLIRMVKTLSKVPILHQKRKMSASPPSLESIFSAGQAKPETGLKTIGLLLIGASTGGPPVVSKILGNLPKPLPIPAVVVQHITKGFAVGFAEWLTHSTGQRTVLVEKTTPVEPGTVYIASDEGDMEFSSASTLRACRDENIMTGPHPNIDRLFMSAAEHARSAITAIVLTGMGSDGTAGLAALRKRGASALAQNPETCAVDSMPLSALRSGAAQRMLSPEEIVDFLTVRLTRNMR